MNGKNVVAVITCDHVNELHAEPFWCTVGQATDLFTDIIGVPKMPPLTVVTSAVT